MSFGAKIDIFLLEREEVSAVMISPLDGNFEETWNIARTYVYKGHVMRDTFWRLIQFQRKITNYPSFFLQEILKGRTSVKYLVTTGWPSLLTSN